MIRAHGETLPIRTEDEALAMVHKLKAHNLAWIEEPVYPVDDYDAMARIRGETGVTVAAGENFGNAGEARAIELGALDIFQPSVTKIGDIAAMREANRHRTRTRRARHATLALFRAGIDCDAARHWR